MSPEFFQTLMGKKFYESTAPEVARQLKRIADQLEKANDLKELELNRRDNNDK